MDCYHLVSRRCGVRQDNIAVGGIQAGSFFDKGVVDPQEVSLPDDSAAGVIAHRLTSVEREFDLLYVGRWEA